MSKSKNKYFRLMHTTPERRRWTADIQLLQEYPELKLRYRRSIRALPDSWDDISAISYNGWKHHRKTQYRIKNEKPKKDSTRYGLHMSRRGHGWTQHRHCYISPCNYCKRRGIIYCGDKSWYKLRTTYHASYFY